MELVVGRFPAKSPAQCSVMVAKTLAYEKNLAADSLWMCRLTTIVREGGDSDDTIYWNDARCALNLARAAGFGCDSLSRFQGDDSADVITAIAAGTGIVLFRGIGVVNWFAPFKTEPSLTNNGNKLPIVLSITCATMTYAEGESMVGDAWVKAGTVGDLRGAVAFFGNTYSTYDVVIHSRSAVTRGFFTGLFSEGKDQLGWTVLRAKEQPYQEFPTNEGDYRGFNLFGDPALHLWTAAPRPLTVIHPTEIFPTS